MPLRPGHLSLARRGAVVTGVDYSKKAISLAKEISLDVGIEARFIESDIYDLPSILSEEFDIVFTSYGVLCWLPDLGLGFCRQQNAREGGSFLLVEDHPMASIIDEVAQAPIRCAFPYFSDGGPTKFEVEGLHRSEGQGRELHQLRMDPSAFRDHRLTHQGRAKDRICP